jgi:hypothetical protein
MKRGILYGIIALVLGLSISFGLTRPAYASAPYGKEGADIATGTNGIIGLILQILGGCSSGETVPQETGDILYFFQDVQQVIGQYFGGSTCPEQISYQHSTLAGLSNTTIALFNPPVRTSDFAIDLGHTLGFLPKKVEAQGIGFSGLSVLLPIWKAFRNIAYGLLAIILVVIGFMVMFRKKIDPKTVVTVQNAIPRVIVALLLVTFSYAIVGFMIDLMYFTIVLAANLITSAADNSLGVLINVRWNPNWLNPSTWLPHTVSGATAQEVIKIFLNNGVGAVFQFVFGGGFQAFDDIGKLLIGNLNPVAQVGTVIVPGLLGYLIAGGGKTGALVAGLTNGPVLLLLIMLIVLIFGFIRLIFMLVDAYINIIISLLFSPFQLMLEAIPGTNSFSSWFRWLLAKVITFPVTAILLMIAAFLTSTANADKLWAPPLLAGGEGTSGLAGFIGLGMLLVIPSIVDSIQKALKAEPFIPGGVGAVIGPIGSGVGQLWQLGYQASFISSSVRHKPDTRSPIQTVREGSQKGFGAITGGAGEGH